MNALDSAVSPIPDDHFLCMYVCILIYFKVGLLIISVGEGTGTDACIATCIANTGTHGNTRFSVQLFSDVFVSLTNYI